MSPLLFTTVLAFAPAAPAPAAAAPAPAPVEAAAPVMAPAPAVVLAPTPAPEEVVVTAPAPTATATSTTTVVPAGTSVIVNVYPPPPVEAPAPQPVAVVVAAPVYVPPPAYAPAATPDPAMVQHSIRRFRRSAAGLFAIGGAGLGVALGLQWARLASLDHCLRTSGRDSTRCNETADMDIIGGYYSAIGMAVFVGGSAGGGALLGKAAAHRDVQLNNGALRNRRVAKFVGAASIVASTAWMIGANWRLLHLESRCDDAACLMQYRPLRYAANDGGAIGIAAGATLLGYGVAYDKQGNALMRLRAAPALTRTTAGLSLTGRF